jgi:predicted Rossmann fold flavoprotein
MDPASPRRPPPLVVAGAGAAGFFAAIAAAEALGPLAPVVLLEATAHPLAKVRISGGGRCNVTHDCAEPRELIRHYPRGGRELLGPFHRFGPRDTVSWFLRRGVELKVESDGRMFPVTDSSETIVCCLQQAARDAGVEVRLRCGLVSASAPSAAGLPFRLGLSGGATLDAARLILATGGHRTTSGPSLPENLGHTVQPPVPSLFTFHIADPRLEGLSGLSVPDVVTRADGVRRSESGPLLVTHWGLSGPAILKLSAWAARDLAATGYRFTLHVNFAPGLSEDAARSRLAEARTAHPRRQVINDCPFTLPARLWERLTAAAALAPGAVWTQTSNDALARLAREVVDARFAVTGKSANKEEFVTCGGVTLAEIDFRTLESKPCPGLHFAGEALDIDGVTGGFNFQAAWTTGWIAGTSAGEALAASLRAPD